MNGRRSIVVFTVDDQRGALPLRVVDRAVRAVEVTPLPDVPELILGAVNVQGQVLPVVSLRRWLGRPDRAIEPEDHLLVVHSDTGRLVLLVDEVCGVVEYEPRQASPVSEAVSEIPAGCELLDLADGLVLVPDLERIKAASEAAPRATGASTEAMAAREPSA
ncbi:MAG: chemotaxis protein CheW [Pirellulaceae bacterium]|nr:chemotaxis protein CheW [Pirellulaceae bacterium]